jgi:2'-5' RNA ligase
MAKTTRTFVAISIPENLGAKLGRLQSQLAAQIPGVRWASSGEFHLTLAFLGDVDDTDLNDVCRAVAEVSKDVEPFDLRIESFGVFPDAVRPRTLWTGLIGPGLEPPGHRLAPGWKTSANRLTCTAFAW